MFETKYFPAGWRKLLQKAEQISHTHAVLQAKYILKGWVLLDYCFYLIACLAA